MVDYPSKISLKSNPCDYNAFFQQDPESSMGSTSFVNFSKLKSCWTFTLKGTWVVCGSEQGSRKFICCYMSVVLSLDDSRFDLDYTIILINID